MSKTARQFLGELGTMKGDVEVAIFKRLRDRGVTSTECNGTLIEVKSSAETNQVRAVFIDGTPAMRCHVERLVDVLEDLERETT